MGLMADRRESSSCAWVINGDPEAGAAAGVGGDPEDDMSFGSLRRFPLKRRKEGGGGGGGEGGSNPRSQLGLFSLF